MTMVEEIPATDVRKINALDGIIKCQHAWCCEIAEDLYTIPVIFSVNGYVAKASVALCRKCGEALRGMQ